MRFLSNAYRVACCQLHFHPATTFTLNSGQQIRPLREPIYPTGNPQNARILDSLELDNEQLRSDRRRFQEILFTTYLQLFEARVRFILDVCRWWNVDLVVFPEFSIPGELLIKLGDAATGMVVAMGSHTVTAGLLKSDIYQELGWNMQQVSEGISLAPISRGSGFMEIATSYRQRVELLPPGTFPILLSSHTNASRTESQAGIPNFVILPGDPFNKERLEPEEKKRIDSILRNTNLIIGPNLSNYPDNIGSIFYFATIDKIPGTSKLPQYVVFCPESNGSVFSYARLRSPNSDPVFFEAREPLVEQLLMVDLNFDRASPPRKVLEARFSPSQDLRLRRHNWINYFLHLRAGGD